MNDLKSSYNNLSEPLATNLIKESNLLLADGITESDGVFSLTGKQLNRAFSTSGFPIDFSWKPRTKVHAAVERIKYGG